jgi:hypothetical protein
MWRSPVAYTSGGRVVADGRPLPFKSCHPDKFFKGSFRFVRRLPFFVMFVKFTPFRFKSATEGCTFEKSKY